VRSPDKKKKKEQAGGGGLHLARLLSIRKIAGVVDSKTVPLK
jgi:hypothetical protein